MKIRDFGVEMWMNEFENHCVLNLAETCVASITIDDLLTLAGKNDTALSELLPMKMTYGAIEGTDTLRNHIADLYSTQTRENIVVTHGTISANALIYETLVEPGDHVISVLPTYQQHYSIPASLGADVDILPLRAQNAFLPEIEHLRGLMRKNTRLIALNNPNNPTGSLMDQDFLKQITEIARQGGCHILCDEVYRGVDQDGDGFTVSIADVYEKGISTAGMSKVFSLAGLRLGWIAAPQEVIEAVNRHRDYNTISVGMINDHFAAMALGAKEKILERSRRITRDNLQVLDDWIASQPLISYVKPRSATTALLKYDIDLPSREFCIRLLEQTGVMLVPGSALDMEGYLRLGFACERPVLEQGLDRLSDFLKTL